MILNLTTEEEKPASKTPLTATIKSPTKPNTKRKLIKRDKSSTDDRKQSKPSNLSSSLFSANPDIPLLETKADETSVETIFDDDSFDILNISKNIKGNLKSGFKCQTMTKVQKEAIPIILSNRDVQVKSATGSGKTLAYAVPVLEFLQRVSPPICRTDGLYCIVILPTRELVCTLSLPLSVSLYIYLNFSFSP